MTLNWIQRLIAASGAALAGVMFFANQLGMDSDANWGRSRILLFIAGVLVFAAAVFYKPQNRIGRLIHTAEGQTQLGAGAAILAVIFIYLWLASAGKLSNLPNETSYYDLLASAFRAGQTSLLLEPDPALAALKNVYEPSQREGIEVLWDASYYNGKYYLYWGPAPSLLLAGVKFFYTENIGDKPIVLFFSIATLTLLTCLLLDTRSAFFPQTPKWATWVGILFVGLVNPLPYLQVEARIYEAAIIAAQFFFIGGLYGLFKAIQNPKALPLILSGICFALSVGTRTTMLIPAAFIAMLTITWAFKTNHKNLLVAFFIPVIIGGVSYAAYNYARFGSITEFGYRYQFTSYNMLEHNNETFSTKYILPNLYKTLLNPTESRKVFPYIYPTRWAGPDSLGERTYPPFYLLFAEEITGIWIGSPFLIFALLAFFRFPPRRNWILLSQAGSMLLMGFSIQIFFFTAMRYLADWIPVFSILAVSGFWNGFELFEHKGIKYLYSALAAALFLYSVFMSFTLAISGNTELFKLINPQIFTDSTLNTFYRLLLK